MSQPLSRQLVCSNGLPASTLALGCWPLAGMTRSGVTRDAAVRTIATALEQGRSSQAVVSISDTGPGLSGDMKGGLFRPFATTKPNGTGLGLALSRRLVQHYGGTLTIDSAPGRGLTAIVRLPAAG